MIGAILGDIIGSRYEFNNTLKYNFPLFGNGCSFTDDTVCTVAIADAILSGVSYKEKLLEWCNRYPVVQGSYGGRFNAWIHSEDPQPYNSFGNGSAMRVSPIDVITFRVLLAYKPQDYNTPAKLQRKKIGTEIDGGYETIGSVPFDKDHKLYYHCLINPEPGYIYKIEWEK